MAKTLTNLDAFRTVSRDFASRQSPTATVFNVLALVAFASILIMELVSFERTIWATDVSVEKEMDDSLSIQFDIEVHAIECLHLRFAVWDQFGGIKVAPETKLLYFPLDLTGKNIAEAREVYAASSEATLASAAVLSRKGARPSPPAWASTSSELVRDGLSATTGAQDVTYILFFADWCPFSLDAGPVFDAAAAAVAGKHPHRDGVLEVKFFKVNCASHSELCRNANVDLFPTLRGYRRDGAVEDIRDGYTTEAIKAHLQRRLAGDSSFMAPPIFPGGCRLQGMVNVSRVPGRFSLVAESGNHSLNPSVANVSHTVHHFSFGSTAADSFTKSRIKNVKKVKEYAVVAEHLTPIDGRTFTTERAFEAPEHYLKVAHTKMGKKKALYQLTHTSQNRKIKGLERQLVPHIRFSYDFSPLTVSIQKRDKPWYEFLTSLIGLLGGSYTVVQLCGGATGSLAAALKGDKGQ